MDGIVKSSRLQPDLVLMDMVMPGMNGIEATRRIKALKQPPRVVILSLHDNSEYRTAASAMGSDGYISKAEFTERLVPFLRTLFPAGGA
jgi:DNA-binding NarL/FixJ family response regulator